MHTRIIWHIMLLIYLTVIKVFNVFEHVNCRSAIEKKIGNFFLKKVTFVLKSKDGESSKMLDADTDADAGATKENMNNKQKVYK
ncbi:hypothetical protein HanHA300_Chr11g0403421 [Helianthus annuus]|nr:hypothetical protein HanHA300_Chr11g0403421 [Helianthus annuus]KAJ0517584.1 hypothetical protein HanHA89_Chr11g0427011 [Helianthus annuus]KAJ0685596.1 hypothetical protein HanLR1_Chr11g0404471 [Helianthus annuus]KAJ0689486.1 hypothetical protein HanOQP8_Chr11g0406251 [Helianthus annuus]